MGNIIYRPTTLLHNFFMFMGQRKYCPANDGSYWRPVRVTCAEGDSHLGDLFRRLDMTTHQHQITEEIRKRVVRVTLTWIMLQAFCC